MPSIVGAYSRFLEVSQIFIQQIYGYYQDSLFESGTNLSELERIQRELHVSDLKVIALQIQAINVFSLILYTVRHVGMQLSI